MLPALEMIMYSRQTQFGHTVQKCIKNVYFFKFLFVVYNVPIMITIIMYVFSSSLSCCY